MFSPVEFQALLARVLKRGRANNNRAFSVAAILTVGLAFGMVMQAPRWAPMAYMTLTTAMSQGTANVDSTHWETG
ncbi:MAG: hypothetical protein WCI34_03580, partial [Actinomycetes bacterium]